MTSNTSFVTDFRVLRVGVLASTAMSETSDAPDCRLVRIGVLTSGVASDAFDMDLLLVRDGVLVSGVVSETSPSVRVPGVRLVSPASERRVLRDGVPVICSSKTRGTKPVESSASSLIVSKLSMPAACLADFLRVLVGVDLVGVALVGVPSNFLGVVLLFGAIISRLSDTSASS